MNRRYFLALGVGSPLIAALSACNQETLLRHAEVAVDRLVPQLMQALDPSRPIMVAPFMDVDRPSSVSTFGRAMADLVGSVLVQRGISVDETRLASVLVRRADGELVLTQEAASLGKSHNAQAILTGTYAVLSPKVIATAKVIRIGDNRILASADSEMRHEI